MNAGSVKDHLVRLGYCHHGEAADFVRFNEIRVNGILIGSPYVIVCFGDTIAIGRDWWVV